MLKNAYFKDRLDKHRILGHFLQLKMFKILLVENPEKISPLAFILFEISLFLWSGQVDLKSTFPKF
jgi:hypothetical protein